MAPRANHDSLELIHCRGHGSATRNLSGVIICPATRTAVIRRTPSPCAIIRIVRGKSIFSVHKVAGFPTRLVRDGMGCFLSGFHGNLRGHDAAVKPQREKAVAARGAAVGGRAEKPKNPGEHSHAVLAGNSLHVQVPAHSAVHVADVPDGSGPRIKTQVAGAATPGAQSGNSNRVVFDTASARAARTVAMTGRTKQIHFTPGKSGKKNT